MRNISLLYGEFFSHIQSQTSPCSRRKHNRDMLHDDVQQELMYVRNYYTSIYRPKTTDFLHIPLFQNAFTVHIVFRLTASVRTFYRVLHLCLLEQYLVLSDMAEFQMNLHPKQKFQHVINCIFHHLRAFQAIVIQELTMGKYDSL